ncbi:MAG: KUP/HAK/KT family potassium transporter [Candidatus Saccharimonadales bacterium]
MTKINKSIAALTIGALGVVFGDIGTSPLYALQVVFGQQGQHLAVSQLNVYGIISLVIWSIILVVSIKFIGFIMRADNEGEGGIMALVSLVKSTNIRARYKWFFITIGLIGVALFYGDSAITPAISVLSAVEGLHVVAPSLGSFILPITLIVLIVLFWIQKYGTNILGKLFGPVMLLWFITIALGGGWQIWQHPGVLQTLSPLTAIDFFIAQPFSAFIAMTAVVLAITGAEALYADMGHFGRRPIAKAWFLVVFPALALCYMGQGALILHSPDVSSNLLVQLFPGAVQIPVVILATIATIVASQSVISGAFSLTKQAVQLGFLPKMLVKHTSDRAIGQVYVPLINSILFVSVILLVILFGSSDKLANAYGIAVSGTLAADTILFLVVLRTIWRRSKTELAVLAVIFLSVDLLFISSNLTKIFHGGLFPVIIGVFAFLIMSTWLKGGKIVDAERIQMEGPLQGFIDKIHAMKPAVKRVPGAAVFIGHHSTLAPLALHATVEEFHELPEKVVIVSVHLTTAAHVPKEERAVFEDLTFRDGISHVTLSYGFHDSINIPKALKAIRRLNGELDFNPDTATYIVSSNNVVYTKRRNLARWRKSIYGFMSKNAMSVSDYYKLPIERTEEMRISIKL